MKKSTKTSKYFILIYEGFFRLWGHGHEIYEEDDLKRTYFSIKFVMRVAFLLFTHTLFDKFISTNFFILLILIVEHPNARLLSKFTNIITFFIDFLGKNKMRTFSKTNSKKLVSAMH
jgi:hypothetical protein